MRKRLLPLLFVLFLPFSPSYAQEPKGVLPCFQHGVTTNSLRDATAGICWSNDYGVHKMYQGTFSFRSSVAGDSTTGYHDMLSWNSDDYIEGNLRRKNGNLDFRFNFRLLYPEGYDKNYEPGYPLLIMLHGGGERANCWKNCFHATAAWNPKDNDPPAGPSTDDRLLNNDHQLLNGGLNHLRAMKRANSLKPDDPGLDPTAFPGLVLFPQNLNADWNGEEINSINRMVYLLMENENIDINRVYLHALSKGAEAIPAVLHKDPSLYAGVVMMSPTSVTSKMAGDTALVQHPIWVFQGGIDTSPKPADTKRVVSDFEEMGGSIRHTLYPGTAHATWVKAFPEPDFYSWTLEQDKSNIHVFYNDSSICNTNGKPVKLGLSYGFAAYEWQKDGVKIPGADGPIYFASEQGTYRARFSRKVANPTATDWNKWSEYVNIDESLAVTPTLTASGTSHFPDINGNSSVTIKTNPLPSSYYYWQKNNTYFKKDELDSSKLITVSSAGVYHLELETYGGCPSLPSAKIYVTTSTPVTLEKPTSLQVQVLSPSSVQLFWTDNSPNETGFEIYRATNATGPYTFIALTAEGVVGYKDSGLESSKTYYYNLRAVNNTAVSPYTGNKSVITSEDNTPPSTPSNLVSTANTVNSISLSWDASTDNTGIKQYHVFYGSGQVATGNNNTTYTLTGLTANKPFIITVKAEDYDDNLSFASNQLNATTIVSGLTYAHSTGSWETLDDPGIIATWDNPEYSGVVDKVRIDNKVQADYFNFKFDGYLYITTPGQYQFQTVSDDGSRMYMNGFTSDDLLVENDGIHETRTVTSSPQTLAVGSYPITVTYFEDKGEDNLTLKWKVPGTGLYVEVPPSAFKSAEAVAITPPDEPANLSASATGMTSTTLNWNYTGGNPDNLKVVVLGSSTAEGTGSSAGNSWVEKLDTWLGNNTPTHSLVNLAQGGFTTQDIMPNGSSPPPDPARNITAALNQDPDVIIINLPSNDTADGIPMATSMDNFRTIKGLADAVGVRVLITTTQPRNFGDDQTKRDLLQARANAIRTEFGDNVIDIYDNLTDFADGKRIKSIYNSGDGVHVNDGGHAYIFSEAQAKMSELLTNFEIYRSTASNGTYAIVGQTLNGEKTFNDQGLLPNTTYYYKAKTINLYGASGFSNIANVKTTGDTQAPTVPADLTLVSFSGNNAVLSWTASIDNVGVTGYEIYSNNVLAGTSESTTFTGNFMSPSNTIKVRAVDASGNKSGYSNEVNFNIEGAIITYYSKPTGNLESLSSWGTNPDGSGTNPTAFDYSNQEFMLTRNGDLSNSLTITGSLSKLIVAAGKTLTIGNELMGNIEARDNAVINVNFDYAIALTELSQLSTVNYNAGSTIAATTYGNLNLNGSGNKNFSGGITAVTGNFTVADGVVLKGAPGNTTELVLSQGVNFNGSTGTAALDNQMALTFNSSHPVSLTTSTDVNFFKLTLTQGDLDISNLSASPIAVNLGSSNGGGLDIGNNLTFILGENDLNINGDGTINPTNNTGKISMNGGDLSVTSGSTSNSHVYFDDSNNDVTRLTTAIGSSSLTVHSPVNLTDGIKITSGTVNSNGNITLKSTAQATANIKEIENGGAIAGNVVVERYMANKGKVYRYLSSPVGNVSVADLQQFIEITGNFTGADTWTTDPSMFTYDEPAGGYQPFPAAGGSDQEELQKGVGYPVYITDKTQPITLITTGVPYQGDVTFSLTPGTASTSDGWNLIGNPFASPVVWDNTGWTSSGVSHVIFIRSNDTRAGGTNKYMVWDKESGMGQPGAIERGKIPAGQAFWVQTITGSPNLTVTEQAKTIEPGTDNEEFYRKEETGDVNYAFSVSVNNDQFDDYALIKFRSGGQNTYDKLYDGSKRYNTFFNLSTASTDNKILAVNDLSDQFCSRIIPLSLSEGKTENGEVKNFPTGVYHLTFGNMESFNIAAIELIDSLENEVITVSSSTDYTFNVSSGSPSSFKDRFYLNVVKTEVELDKAVSAPVTVCTAVTSATLNIIDSQPSVEYVAVLNNETTVSDAMVGNGNDLTLTIDPKLLLTGENQIRIKAKHAGCNPRFLSNGATIILSENPVTTLEQQLYRGCVGDELDIKAAGAGPNGSYRWYDEYHQLIDGESSDVLTVNTLTDYYLFFVKAVNEQGCVAPGDNNYIEIKADSIPVPAIEFNNGLLQTDATANVQWYFNDEIITGANSAVYLPEASGTYAVAVSSASCTKFSENYAYVVTGIFQPVGDETFSLTVYPNPSDQFNFNIKGNSTLQTDITLEVIDVTGRVKLQKVVSPNDYRKGVLIEPKEQLARGVYIIQIGQAGKTLQKKLIVE